MRSRGTTTPKLRPHGRRWQLLWHQDGRQQNRSWPRLEGETDRQAAKRLAEEIGRCLAGKRDSLPGKRTLGAVLDLWLRDYKPDAPQTRYLAEISVKRKLKPQIGHLVAARLEPFALTDWKNGQLEHGRKDGGPLKPSTVARDVTVLRLAIAWAGMQRLLDRDLVRDILAAVKAPKPDGDAQPEYVVIEPDLLLALRDALLERGYRGRPVVHMLDTGMRPCEVVGLSWPAVKAEHLEIVRKGIRIPGKGLVYGKPKTRAGLRDVGIPDCLRDVLDKQRSWQAFQHKRIGTEWKNARDLVYTTDRGGPLDNKRLNQTFHEACAAIGIPACPVYSLRHTWISVMLDRSSLTGVPDTEISRQAGHRDVGFTHRQYGHGLKNAPRRIAAAWNAILTDVGKEAKEKEA